MSATVRSIAAQGDKPQRDKDNRNAAEVERIRADLSNSSKQNNRRK